ncbi:hypothetical protein GIB67_023268 [Kingdonia uniflora]|uniref:Uncharacterized protein n=1 Tax=Kingdonia uniflora TaxID=39325 RepID=A0A7J7MSQ9_9MAGN|nr:hypothetical protein GIB67_023268 [Kingdonia uniflora]
MLGTLPSKYLKWVSKTLRARDYEEWAKLADEVLQDPVYKDRLEWELAEKILTGDDCNNKTSSTRNPVSDLLDVSVRFGWDNDDKVGWSKIDFALLGTSKSARIPRRKLGFQDQTSDSRVSDSRVCVERERGKREERIERQRLKRGGLKMSDDEPLDLSGLKCKDRDGEDPTVNKTSNPFPGRDSLFKRAVDRRRVS